MEDTKPTDRSMSIFSGIEQCSEVTGIPQTILKRVKAHPDGIAFIPGTKMPKTGFHVSGRIYAEHLLPWYAEHKEELESMTVDDYEKWRAIRMEAQAQLAQIELEEKKNSLVEVEKVKALLKRIGAAQASLFNGRFRQELLPKLVGKSLPEMTVLADGVLAEIFEVVAREIAKWK